MTALLAVSALFTSQATPFFPMESGQTWEYLISVTSSVVRVRQVQKTLPEQAYDGAPAVPLEIYLDGKIDTTGYYRVANGFVTLVGLSGNARLPEPIKVVPVDPKRGQKWNMEGTTLMLGMMVPMKSESRVTTDGEIEVLGKKVRSITIETKSQIGEGDTAMHMLSTDVYAHGIGMVSRRQESTPGKNTNRKSIAITTLVRYEKAGG
jgi:hypothetical protein